MHILKEVCYMTTSFPAIHCHFFKGAIEAIHMSRNIATLVATIHYNKRSVVDSRKIEEYAYLRKTIDHCGPALLKVLVYSTELVAIIFF